MTLLIVGAGYVGDDAIDWTVAGPAIAVAALALVAVFVVGLIVIKISGD